MENNRGDHTYQEIISQGKVWQTVLQGFEEQSKAILNMIRQPYGEVIFTGCGSTYYLSLAAAAAWQALTGIPARAVPASELWLFPDMILSKQDMLLVAVSRSGETSETLRAVQVFQQRKGPDVLCVSVDPESELIKKAPFSLLAQGAHEKSVAQTRSFTSMFLLTLAAAYQAAAGRRGLDDLRLLPVRFELLVNRYEPLSRQLAEDSSLKQFTFLGSGWNFGLACEVMLKMKEMSLSSSEAFHFLEFRHGPKSMVAPGTLIVALLSDSAYDQEVKVLEEMHGLGATILAFVEKEEGVPADYVVELQSGLPGLPRAVLQLPILQLMAFHRALAKGLNPDRPANLDAVVRL